MELQEHYYSAILKWEDFVSSFFEGISYFAEEVMNDQDQEKNLNYAVTESQSY